MGEPTEISAESFFEFIDTPGPVVLFLSIHPAHPFNRALPRRLREEHGDEVPFGTTALLDLVVSASPALPFLQQGLAACGVSAPVDALPGYYLFQSGRMLTWDSGLPIGADVQAIARGSVLGLVAFAFTQDVSVLGKTLRIASDEVTAVRVTRRFHALCEDRRADDSSPRAPRQTPPRAAPPRPPSPEEELSRAYRTLGVSPTASNQEVEAAWRELRIKHHPDLAAGDPAEFNRRSRLATEINRARDVIRAHRSRAAN